MIYRELPMIDVKDAPRRWQAGAQQQANRRETGIDRDTLLANGACPLVTLDRVRFDREDTAT
jgi:hypothetical protein